MTALIAQGKLQDEELVCLQQRICSLENIMQNGQFVNPPKYVPVAFPVKGDQQYAVLFIQNIGHLNHSLDCVQRF